MSRPVGDCMEAPDVLQRLGRPEFPQGLRVLLVSNGQREECREIEEQMRKLCYTVTCCESTCEACLQLASTTNAVFDIVLAEASIVSKDTQEGASLLEAVRSMPLVLVSTPDGMTECVWRGIELGAAEVLEKPLSTHKLQNIWQHVVRRALDCKESAQLLPFVSSTVMDKAAVEVQADHHSLQSRKTRSSNQSTQDDVVYMDMDGSFSGSPEVSVDASVSNTSPSEGYTVESTANDSQAKMDWSQSRTAKRSHDNVVISNAFQKQKTPRRGLRTIHSTPVTSHARYAQAVVGMVHPSWTNSSACNSPACSQSFKSSIPPGCVWGTPLNPPPGWQSPCVSRPGPLLGSAATNTSLPRYKSAPMCKVEPGTESLDGFDLADLDSTLMGNLGDDFLLGSDFLDCEDSFLSSLTDDSFGSMGFTSTPKNVLEPLPIGLSLKKSASLLDLISSRLTRAEVKTNA